MQVRSRSPVNYTINLSELNWIQYIFSFCSEAIVPRIDVGWFYFYFHFLGRSPPNLLNADNSRVRKKYKYNLIVS